MRAREAQASSSQSSPAVSAVDTGHLQASRQGSGLQLRCPQAQCSQVVRALFPQNYGYPRLSDHRARASHLLYLVISSQLETTATASHRAPPPSLLPPNCNCIVLLHYSLCRQHALLYLSHCAASRRQQQIYRQGRCSRRLCLVERAPGPSSESIARASVVAGLS